MTKTKKRALIITAAMLIIMFALPMLVNAGGLGGVQIGDVKDPTNGKVNAILGYIKFAGIAIALGMLIIIGIKYVSAADQADKLKNIKNEAIVYAIGAFCIFGAVGLLEILEILSKNILNK